MMSEKQIKDRIYMLEREVSILKSILETKREGFGRPKGSIKYSDEEVEFLKECSDKGLSDNDIIIEFNNKFNTDISLYSRKLYNFMDRQGMLNERIIKKYS